MKSVWNWASGGCYGTAFMRRRIKELGRTEVVLKSYRHFNVAKK
jgi:hypothetical protein